MRKNKFVFITGSNGQLGTSLSKTFKNNGWHVYGMDLKQDKNDHLDVFIEGKVQNRKDFKKLLNLPNENLSNEIDLCLINNAGISVLLQAKIELMKSF